VRGDASVLADLDRLYATVGEQGRGIDVLVANAGGGGGSARIEEVTEERFDAVSVAGSRAHYDNAVRPGWRSAQAAPSVLARPKGA